MGNLCRSFSIKLPKRKRPIRRSLSLSRSSNRRIRTPSIRRESNDPSTQQQALADTQQQALAATGQPASLMSRRNRLPQSSTSITRRSRTDQLVNQDIRLDDLETRHFILVHGGGFGAWCWYKTIALLEEGGYEVTAVDLTGSGIDASDENGIDSLSEYVKPLTDFLDKLADDEKVILVGHDLGGACISFAMEMFPHKISKAIFVAAAMLTDGQSAYDMISQQASSSNNLMQQAYRFFYAKVNSGFPTSIAVKRSFSKDYLFNLSPDRDVALAYLSMRPIPFAPVLEKLSLSEARYGTVRRFYVQTLEDNAMPIAVQENIIHANPPERVFILKADHSPFFSKPQAHHKILVEISMIPPPSENTEVELD